MQPYAALGRLVLAAADRFALPADSADALQAARLMPRLASLVRRQRGPRCAPTMNAAWRCRRLARWLAGAGPTAAARPLVLDDLQFADDASLAALQVLAEPAAAAGRCAWALALRPDEAGAQAQALLASLAAQQPVGPGSTWPRCRRTTRSGLLDSLGLPALGAGAWAGPLWRQVGGQPRPSCWNR